MEPSQYILAGRFIDGIGTKMRRNVLLVVRDGMITGIISAENLARHPGPITDLSHHTILPALVDCSVSLLRSPSIAAVAPANTRNQVDLTERFVRHRRDCFVHGVLGVAENDNLTPLIKTFSQEPGLDELPRVSVPVSNNRNDSHMPRKSTGVDFCRIHYSKNIEEADAGPEPTGEVPARFDRRSGLKKIIVANGRQQVSDALAVGCDAIEQGYNMGEDNLRKMAEHDVLWIPSPLRAKNALDGSASGGSVCCRFSLRYVAPGRPEPGAEDYWKKTLTGQLKLLQKAREFGIRTAIGTGAGNVGILHGESLVEEMKLFIKAGYSMFETIRCASTTAADFFDMNHIGPLTVGNKATFLVSRGTPQQLPRKLAYLEDIYINGAPSPSYRKNPVKSVP